MSKKRLYPGDLRDLTPEQYDLLTEDQIDEYYRLPKTVLARKTISSSLIYHLLKDRTNYYTQLGYKEIIAQLKNEPYGIPDISEHTVASVLKGLANADPEIQLGSKGYFYSSKVKHIA